MRCTLGVLGPALALIVAVAGGCGSVEQERPFAVAGPDQRALVETRVVLDGRASRAPEGVELLFEWDLLVCPEGSVAILSDPSAPITTFVPDIEGFYFFHLLVSDGVLTSEDAMSVEAVAPDPFAPRANAGPDQEVFPGALVTLDGSASRSPDGALLTFHWITLERPRDSGAILSDRNSPIPSFFADARGIYRFQLTVVGTSGSRSSDIVSVFADTVPVPLPPPVIDKGRLIYDQHCSICHSLRTYDPSSGGAPDLFLRGWRMEAVFTTPHAGIALTPEEIAAVQDFLDKN